MFHPFLSTAQASKLQFFAGGVGSWLKGLRSQHPVCLSPVTFEDCAGNEAVVLHSSDPRFGVRADGSIFAAGEANLEEPVQFKLTAEGPRAHVWETVVQLALIDPPPAPQMENEVSCVPHERAHRPMCTETDLRPSFIVLLS